MKTIQFLRVSRSKALVLACGFACAAFLSGTAGQRPTAPARCAASDSGYATLSEGSVRLVPIPLRASHQHQRAVPHLRNQNGTSLNWSGYAVQTSLSSPQKGAVTYVAGSWTVPTVSASSSPATYSSCWVGIDGYSDSTVEQIGTEQDWSSGTQQNYVWFEMYPRGAYLIVDFPIAAGDSFGAGVTYLGSGVFSLSITNYTQHAAFTVPPRYTRLKHAQRSSAEWIVEAPFSGGLLPLADFGTVSFKNCVATLNGTMGPINDSLWQYDPITMETDAGVVKAQPSGLTGTTSSAFSVKWFDE